MSESSKNFWTNLLNSSSDAEEFESSQCNGKAENPLELAVIDNTQLPAPPQHQNIYFGEPAGPSSCQPITTQDVPNAHNMNTVHERYVMNPLTVIKNQQLPVPALVGEHYTLRSGVRSFEEDDLQVRKKGRKRIIEGTEEFETRKKTNLIKNRAAAAKSRARKADHIKQQEERLEELRDENVRLKKLVDEELRKRREEMEEEEEVYEKVQTKVEKAAEKLKELRRTSSSPW